MLIVILAPLIIVTAFAWTSIEREKANYNTMLELKSYIRISHKLSAVILELQRERGLSFGYKIDKSNLQVHNLIQQRIKTVQAVKELILINRQIKSSGDAEFYLTNQKVNQELENLLSVKEILYQLFLGESANVFNYYSQIIDDCLHLINYLPLVVSNTNITKLLYTYSNLQLIQESLGKERGYLHGLLSKNQFNVEQISQVHQYSSEFDFSRKKHNEFEFDKYQTLLNKVEQSEQAKFVVQIRTRLGNYINKQSVLNEFHELMGYGGLIHLYKNYLIRGSEKLYSQFYRKHIQAQLLLESLKQVEFLSEREQFHIKQISATIADYYHKIDEIKRLQAQGFTAIEIDKLVKVNDQPALDSLNIIRTELVDISASKWWEVSTNVIDQYFKISEIIVSDINTNIEKLLISTSKRVQLLFLLLILSVISGLLFGYILIRRLVVDIKEISRVLVKSRKDLSFNELIDVKGEDEIGQMAEEFNRLFLERKVHEQKLNYAKEQAEAGTEAKSQFLSTMSHEIRTPMNAIIGMSHLALQTEQNEESKKYIENVHQAGKSLLGIINDILDFSKIESGKMELESISFNLDEVLDNLRNIIQFKVEEKGLELLFNLDPKIPLNLVGDPLRLSQIFINLVNNAVKFTDSGDITISSKLIDQTDSESIIQFSVEDTGIGISDNAESKLFQPFTQTDSSISRKYGGTGLGLTISKNFVELMGGDIWIESTEGIGSTFFFKVKLGYEEESQTLAPEQDHSIHAVMTKTQAMKSLIGAKILLVEDNELNQKVASKILSNQGVNVSIANNGQEALDMLKPGLFDGILMDIQMPVMDGYEATMAIRKFEYFKDLVIIAVSGNLMPEEIQLMYDSGMNDYIHKPIDVEEIFIKLAKWIEVDDQSSVRTIGSQITIEQEAGSDKENSQASVFYQIFNPKHIDVQRGLKNTQQSTELYAEVLNKFFVSYERFDDMIIQNLIKIKQEQPEENSILNDFIRVFHTLKTASGTIGISNIEEKSEQIENQLKYLDGSNIELSQLQEIEVDIENLRLDMTIFINHLREVIENHVEIFIPQEIESELPKKPLAEQEFLSALEDIRKLVIDFNYDAVDLVSDLITKCQYKENSKILKKLLHQIKEYEFSDAEETIETMLENSR
ncbi:MAG: response regulator [Gammaproteobacteria bacterium]|nr:response regulator [Gammaproteobacteria bacterium]